MNESTSLPSQTQPSAPVCVGIILDGNRRWARQHGLPTFEGHRRGFDNIETIVLAARDLGVQHVVVYAFSTENWKRTEEEVSYLMNLLEEATKNSLRKLNEEGVHVRFVGQRERFSPSMQEAMLKTESAAPKNTRLTLWICLSYGGRAELVQAAQTLALEGKEITEESLAARLWTGGDEPMPDPDLIIRAGGEHRLSNFLLWQAAYSELFFPKTYWPEFSKEDLEAIFEEFAVRERRMGV